MSSLLFEPADSIHFHISERDDGGLGAAEGALRVTNVAPGDAPVVLKVKTNAAERYLVHPHILMLGPGETKEISGAYRPLAADQRGYVGRLQLSFTGLGLFAMASFSHILLRRTLSAFYIAVKVPPSQLDAFKQDIARQSPGIDSRRSTAFLMLAWRLTGEGAASVASELEALPNDKSRALTLNTMWKSQEKQGSSSQFESTKFSVRCDSDTEDRVRLEVYGTSAPAAFPRSSPGDTPASHSFDAVNSSVLSETRPGQSAARGQHGAPGPSGGTGVNDAADISSAHTTAMPLFPASAPSSAVKASRGASSAPVASGASEFDARLAEASDVIMALTAEKENLVRALGKREREIDVRGARSGRDRDSGVTLPALTSRPYSPESAHIYPLQFSQLPSLPCSH